MWFIDKQKQIINIWKAVLKTKNHILCIGLQIIYMDRKFSKIACKKLWMGKKHIKVGKLW